ncbi:MAG: hypothetical protein A2W01_00050 [Candidatus Solincola sediminis]|nr:MAG: hypothetical protein A2W01_00050 [Candidatus Solincola sediminis]
MREAVISRREAKPARTEIFPEHISYSRRERVPILYVSGFFGFNILSATIRRRLRNLDFELYTVRLPNFAAGDIKKGGKILLQKMEEVRVLLGVRRLSVIGMGLGGLVARCTVEEMGASDYLGRLIMLGTANKGSYTRLPYFLFKAGRQMLPWTSFLDELNESHDYLILDETQPSYVSVYSPYDLSVIPWTSARLEGALNLKLGWFCTHLGMIRSKRVLGILTGLLEGEAIEEPGDEEDDRLLLELNQSLQEDQHNEGNLFRRGKLLLDSGYYEAAVRDLSRAIRQKPDLADAYMLRGKALRHKMSYDENPIYNRAIRDFNQVIRARPGWAEAYYERGVCYALLNAWSEAVDNWDRALILNRDLYQAYLARGFGRRKKGDISGAIKDFTEVLRIQPDEPEALRFLSELGG